MQVKCREVSVKLKKNYSRHARNRNFGSSFSTNSLLIFLDPFKGHTCPFCCSKAQCQNAVNIASLLPDYLECLGISMVAQFF